MGKYTEYRVDDARIGTIVSGRMTDDCVAIKNLPSKMSVTTKDYSERIEDIVEWRKAIRSDKTQFVKLHSEWIPKPKKVVTIEEKQDRINKLKEISYKFGKINN